MIRRTALFALMSAALALGACDQLSKSGGTAAGGKQEIKFSILSTENSQNLEERWKPFIADMEKETGLKITPFYATNYTSLIEAMRFNQVQMGWFSNLSGLEAVRRADGEVFARSSDPSGTDGYFSVVVVKRGSGITLDKLLTCDKSKTFGMGDAKSTSGTLAPMTYLFGPKNVDPQTCFKTVRSANHEANLLSVSNGLIDAATNNNTNMQVMEREHPEVVKNVEVIWTSPRLPEDPIIWRKDLDPATKEKIRSFFLTYGTEPGPEGARRRKILTDLKFGVFKPADNSHLLPVREMEATDQLLEARKKGDAEGVKKAQAELAKIADEKAKAGDKSVAAAPAAK